jgi:hypothetical protein
MAAGVVPRDVEFVPVVRGGRSAGSVPSVEHRSVVSTLLEALFVGTVMRLKLLERGSTVLMSSMVVELECGFMTRTLSEPPPPFMAQSIVEPTECYVSVGTVHPITVWNASLRSRMCS